MGKPFLWSGHISTFEEGEGDIQAGDRTRCPLWVRQEGERLLRKRHRAGKIPEAASDYPPRRGDKPPEKTCLFGWGLPIEAIFGHPQARFGFW